MLHIRKNRCCVFFAMHQFVFFQGMIHFIIRCFLEYLGYLVIPFAVGDVGKTGIAVPGLRLA